MTTEELKAKRSDISSEVRRTYTFPNGQTVTIEKPIYLVVSKNGHRVSDSRNHGHYIPNGWTHLEWEVTPPLEAVIV